MFDTINGWRHTTLLTNTTGGIAECELTHRQHARVEDRIRNWKDCGLANLPFEDFVRNQAWLAATIIAANLLAWTQLLCLDGDLAKAEPSTSLLPTRRSTNAFLRLTRSSEAIRLLN